MGFLRRHWAILLAGTIMAISAIVAVGTYAMVSFKTEQQEQAEIMLPPKSPPGAQVKRKEFVLEIDDSGKPFVAGEPVPISEVKQRMDAEGFERLLLRVSKRARYETLKTILTNLGDQGIASITFSVVDNDKTAAPGSSPADR